jgi:hypothetical protein
MSLEKNYKRNKNEANWKQKKLMPNLMISSKYFYDSSTYWPWLKTAQNNGYS